MRRLALLLTALFLTTALFGADKNSAKVVLHDAVTVGSTNLPAGEYKVSWTNGADSKVTFAQGKKTVAVIPAKVVDEANSQSSVITTADGSTTVLSGLRLKDATLNFGSSTKSAH